jgi:hypothetical protein
MSKKFGEAKAALLWWFLKTFRNKTIVKLEAGAFKVVFKKYWVDIKAPRDWWHLRLRADSFPAGYLFASAGNPDNEDNVEQFADYLYAITDGIFRDQGLANDIRRSINKYHARLQKKAESDSKAVTDAEEQRDARLLREGAKYAKMSRKQRKREREQMRATVREMKEAGEFLEEGDKA